MKNGKKNSMQSKTFKTYLPDTRSNFFDSLASTSLEGTLVALMMDPGTRGLLGISYSSQSLPRSYIVQFDNSDTL